MPRRPGRAAREANAAAQRRRRERLAQAQREAEALLNAERHRQHRAAMEENQREAERQRLRERRAELDEDERDAERAANAAVQRDRRARDPRASRAACAADDVLSGRRQVAVYDVGRRDVQCPHCGALLWRSERATLCCSGGKVQLQPLPPPPPLLRELWTDDTAAARAFRKHARRLNTALSLASLMTREVRQPDGGFSPAVIIQGRLYHRMGPCMCVCACACVCVCVCMCVCVCVRRKHV